MAMKGMKGPGRYSDDEGLVLKLSVLGRGSWALRMRAEPRFIDIDNCVSFVTEENSVI